jgi:hypothetical protein
MPAMAWIGGASRCVADDTIGEEGDVYKLSAPFSKKKKLSAQYISRQEAHWRILQNYPNKSCTYLVPFRSL